MNIITRCARKATRIVVGGDRELARRKVAARRHARRATRLAIHRGDYDYTPTRLTGRDIA